MRHHSARNEYAVSTLNVLNDFVHGWGLDLALRKYVEGVYYTSFEFPDVYEVFQFKVEDEKFEVTCLSLTKQGWRKKPYQGPCWNVYEDAHENDIEFEGQLC
ncbi:hypothetical protein BC332_27987 [Capsicum chinense]|nr:hypothetical protein BC332_27987 [Capsicum chinense]